jgi:hypothetical protein
MARAAALVGYCKSLRHFLHRLFVIGHGGVRLVLASLVVAFFSSFRSSLCADRAQCRRWTRKSSTSSSSSNAHHSQYRRSRIRMTITSRCQRGLGRGRLRRRLRAISLPNLRKHRRTVSFEMSMPRSARRSSTSRNDSVNRA